MNFFLLINMKTKVGIFIFLPEKYSCSAIFSKKEFAIVSNFTFISRTNFMLSWVRTLGLLSEHTTTRLKGPNQLKKRSVFALYIKNVCWLFYYTAMFMNEIIMNFRLFFIPQPLLCPRALTDIILAPGTSVVVGEISVKKHLVERPDHNSKVKTSGPVRRVGYALNIPNASISCYNTITCVMKLLLLPKTHHNLKAILRQIERKTQFTHLSYT